MYCRRNVYGKVVSHINCILHNIGFSWGMSWNPETGETRSNQVGLSSGFNIGKYLLQMALNLDLSDKGDSGRPTVQQQRYFLQRNGKCTGWLIELRERQMGRLTSVYPYKRWARYAVANKNLDAAVDHFEKGLLQTPDDVELLREFAEVLIDQKQSAHESSFGERCTKKCTACRIIAATAGWVCILRRRCRGGFRVYI